MDESGTSHHWLRNMGPETLEFKFTIMRCPIERLISAYFFSKNNLNNKFFEGVKENFIKYNIQSFSDLFNLLKKMLILFIIFLLHFNLNIFG